MHKKHFLICMLLGIMIPVGGFISTPVFGATATQWFPVDGEVCNYSLTWAMGCENGTTWIDTGYNVYVNAWGHQFIVPLTYVPLGYWPYTLAAANAPITIRFTYHKVSDTQLNRSVSIIAGDLVYYPPNATFIFVARPGSWLTSHVLSNNREEPVGINDFSIQPKIFVDYFNIALLPSETFSTPRNALGTASFSTGYLSPTFIQAETESDITAMWTNTSANGMQNGTYVATVNGRVLSYTYFDNTVLSGYPEYRAYRVTFTNTNPPVDTTPWFYLSFETLLILIVSAAALIFSTLALMRANKISHSDVTPAKKKSERK